METGPRPRKLVDYSQYYTEDQIDQALKDCGIDPKVLAEDDENGRFLNLSAGTFSLSEYDFEVDGKMQHVTAEPPKEEGSKYIVHFLNGLTKDQFKKLWDDESYKRAISALMRYPGGMHEWLMIAALPLVKEMEINFGLVKELRTKITDDFQFVWQGKHYVHGTNTGSAHMHQELYDAIKKAKEDFLNEVEEDAIPCLQYRLEIFAERFFNDDCIIPNELSEFIYFT